MEAPLTLPGVSVLINTFNEERNIGNCLRSVAWSTDIVVVDMHSTDKTVSLAEARGARVFLHENLGYADPARQFGLEQTLGPWVFMIDADEVASAELANVIGNFIQQKGARAARVPRRNFWFGEELRHGNNSWKYDRVLRLFRKDSLAYNGRIHDFEALLDGAQAEFIGDAKASLMHFAFATPGQLLAKTDRYTSIEAKFVASETGKANSKRYWLAKQLLKETLFFVFRGEWRSGGIGFASYWCRMNYAVYTWMKLRHLAKWGDVEAREPVMAHYQSLADD